MDTKNVKTARYWQIDNEIKNISTSDEVEMLPSEQAWDKYDWTHKYFRKRPTQGYFMWVKSDPSDILSSCVTLESDSIDQSLNNLLVIEEGLSVVIQGACNAHKEIVGSRHSSVGTLVLKKGAVLDYMHIHNWTNEVEVLTDYEFVLEDNAELNYQYKVLSAPGLMNSNTAIHLGENSKSNLEIVADCKDTDFKVHDSTFLEGKGSSGVSKLRLVGRENSQVCAKSRIVARENAYGHLDCDGLMVNEDSRISLVPHLICENKDAQLTHEASVGRISAEQLNYLRMRGLTEEQAMNLIISGFLGFEFEE